MGRAIEYSYNPTANDGRITKRKELSGEEVDYLHDSLGRLISAATTGWGLNFTYDGFGNKMGQAAKPGWTGSGTVPQPSYTVDVATNRLGGFGYDANGNVISGLAGLGGTYTYDVENRMVNNGADEKYGYGTGNRRLWSSTTFASAEVYFDGLGREVLEVFLGRIGALERYTASPTQRVWFGRRPLEKQGTTMTADRLGSYEKTFPYGELQGTAGTAGEKFAKYWRDATGLDYAVNRYYSSQMGRFLSADPYQASGGPGFCPAEYSYTNCFGYGAWFGWGDWDGGFGGGGGRGGDDGGGSGGNGFLPKDAARVDLGKTDCYKLLGSAAADVAQSWFDKHITFYYSSMEKLQVDRGGPLKGTPQPASTAGMGQVNINRDYLWDDFSQVSTQGGGSYDYLGYMNRNLRTNMTSDQLGTLIIIHELGHPIIAPKQPANTESAGEKRDIYDKCIK